jgi:hypothetical protein
MCDVMHTNVSEERAAVVFGAEMFETSNHIAHLRQEVHNSKFGIFELMV